MYFVGFIIKTSGNTTKRRKPEKRTSEEYKGETG
jgi:hypothetical protein